MVDHFKGEEGQEFVTTEPNPDNTVCDNVWQKYEIYLA